jgi:hypothetical protein
MGYYWHTQSASRVRSTIIVYALRSCSVSLAMFAGNPPRLIVGEQLGPASADRALVGLSHLAGRIILAL